MLWRRTSPSLLITHLAHAAGWIYWLCTAGCWWALWAGRCRHLHRFASLRGSLSPPFAGRRSPVCIAEGEWGWSPVRKQYAASVMEKEQGTNTEREFDLAGAPRAPNGYLTGAVFSEVRCIHITGRCLVCTVLGEVIIVSTNTLMAVNQYYFCRPLVAATFLGGSDLSLHLMINKCYLFWAACWDELHHSFPSWIDSKLYTFVKLSVKSILYMWPRIKNLF